MAVSAALRAVLAVGLAAAVATAAYVATREERQDPAATAKGADPPDPLAATREPEAAASAQPEAATVDTEGAAGSRSDSKVAGEEPVGETAAPRFDVVRVEPDGATVVAGQAAPGATVTIYADDKPLAEVEADAQGGFVAIFKAEPSDQPQALTLDAEGADGRSNTSDEVVMLLPAAPGAAAVPAPGSDAPAAPDRAAAEAGAAGPAVAAPGAKAGTTGAAAGAAGADAAPQVAATAILRPEGAEVAMTAPADAPADGTVRDVTIASISYADAGQITLAGDGTAGSQVRAYVDDRFARDGTVGPSGRWTIDIGDVDAGIYRLRIDQLHPDGTVASRVETPFQRDFPRVLASDPAGEQPIAVTVQPGNNLWTLARQHYGAGVHYTQIFTANRELIRDPELIYPGQIFRLPGALPAGDAGPVPRPDLSAAREPGPKPRPAPGVAD